MSDRRISDGGAGQHVAAAHAPLGAHEPGALQREQDLLEVGLGEAGALGDVADRRGRPRRRGARATAGPGWRSRPWSTPSSRRMRTPAPGDGPGPVPGANDLVGRSARRVARSRAEVSPLAEHPDLPDYGGACVCNIVPALLAPGGTERLPSWMPEPVAGADQVVLLVLDGLGWEQLQARPHLAPDAGRHGRPGHPHGGAVDHGHRPHLDRHRAVAGRARRRRATASRCGARC